MAAGRQAVCAVARDLCALTAARLIPLPPAGCMEVQLMPSTDHDDAALQVAAGEWVVATCV